MRHASPRRRARPSYSVDLTERLRIQRYSRKRLLSPCRDLSVEEFAYFIRECAGSERFLQESYPGLQHPTVCNDVIGVSRHEEHLHSCIAGRNPTRQFAAA